MLIALKRTMLVLMLLCGVCTRANAANFVQTYVDVYHACRGPAPLLTFQKGAQSASAPFGKAAAEWTDDDLRTLQATMTGCLPQPNSFDLSEERQILKKVAAAIEQGRQDRITQEQQAAASREMAQRRADGDARRKRERLDFQEEQAAIREIQAFQGRIMSDVELDRARQLKTRLPKLASWIDNLLAAQDGLRRDAATRAQIAREREEAGRRMQAEQARQALDEQRAAQEAEIEAARKQDAFAKALPNSCRSAQAADKELQEGRAHDEFVRASGLAEAGEAKSACATFVSFAAKMDAVRAALIQCTKDLDQNLDELARDEATRSLSRATEIYTQEKAIARKTREEPCQ